MFFHQHKELKQNQQMFIYNKIHISTLNLTFREPMSYMAVKAFFPPPEDPAGITFKTLNLTVFEIGLQKIIDRLI